jgi:hypothetical protein
MIWRGHALTPHDAMKATLFISLMTKKQGMMAWRKSLQRVQADEPKSINLIDGSRSMTPANT